MKKVFLGITYIILLLMIFVYMLIPCMIIDGRDYGVLAGTYETGLSIIGFLLFFPSLLSTIANLCTKNKVVHFIKDIFSMFCSIFSLAAVLIGFTKMYNSLVVPAVLIVCTAVLLGFSLTAVIKTLKEEKLNQKTEEETK